MQAVVFLNELIDQFIEIANLPHRWLFDVFYPDTTHHARDRDPRRIQSRSFRKKVSRSLWSFSRAFNCF